MTKSVKSPKKQFRFFSAEEKKALEPYYLEGKAVTAENLQSFCQKYQRSLDSCRGIIYNLRMKHKTTTRNKSVAKKDMPVLKKNEFVIPITNWEIRTENGVNNLILKF
jgi:hypothetical protein